MRRLIGLVSFCLLATLAAPAAAQDHEPGEYGRLLIGPRVGPALGISGPRGGYFAGVELTYRTPRFFYYNLEVGFLHLLPRTVTVGQTTNEEGTVIAPEHDIDVTGLYGIPMTLEVGLRLSLNRIRLRIGVGFGAMISIQNAEMGANEVSESIMSFCFRPGIGLDVATGSGLVRIDFAYIWQDANFEITGNDRDVDSLMLTVGYSWLLVE